jgi:hypothetical protein
LDLEHASDSAHEGVQDCPSENSADARSVGTGTRKKPHADSGLKRNTVRKSSAGDLESEHAIADPMDPVVSVDVVPVGSDGASE